MNYSVFTTSKLIREDRNIVDGVVISATTAAVVNVRDGADATGDPVFPLVIAAGDTLVVGIKAAFNAGIYVEVVSGTVAGTVFYS
jgi:hypothetical protein